MKNYTFTITFHSYVPVTFEAENESAAKALADKYMSSDKFENDCADSIGKVGIVYAEITDIDEISEYDCSNDDDTFFVDKETRNKSNTVSDADKILEYDDICLSAFDVKGALEMLVSELEEKPTLLKIPIICEFAENIYSAGRTAAVIERVSKYHPYSWPKDGKYLDSLCNKITKLIDDVLYADKK